jgi:flagellar hook protein FlgE
MITGSGTRLMGVQQQFTQGSLETTDKTLDLAIAGEGFFTVKNPGLSQLVSFTRNGAFTTDDSRYVIDTLGNRMQLLPVDSTTGAVTSTDPADMIDFQLPADDGGTPPSELASVSIGQDGVVEATFTNGTSTKLGSIAMSTFANSDGLRQMGDGHWQASGASGDPLIGAANTGALGTIRSGTLEHANVDITEELVALIAAQRNFSANAKAIETSNQMTQTINNLRA